MSEAEQDTSSTTPPNRTPQPAELPETEQEDASWIALFSATGDQLREMADEALADYEAGRTTEMDFDDDYLGLGSDAE